MRKRSGRNKIGYDALYQSMMEGDCCFLFFVAAWLVSGCVFFVRGWECLLKSPGYFILANVIDDSLNFERVSLLELHDSLFEERVCD